MSLPTSYTAFIKTAKQYANGGEEERLKLMMLLLDMEPRKALWMVNPDGVKSWDLILREEGFCTPTLFRNFKRAVPLMNVKMFGVYAAAAIVNLPKGVQNKVIRQTEAWISTHNLRPTYQRISKYVFELRREMGTRSPRTTPIAQLRVENNRLQRENNKAEEYIDLLIAALKLNNIRVPRR